MKLEERITKPMTEDVPHRPATSLRRTFLRLLMAALALAALGAAAYHYYTNRPTSEAEIAAFESSQSDVQPNVQSDVADRCPTSDFPPSDFPLVCGPCGGDAEVSVTHLACQVIHPVAGGTGPREGESEGTRENARRNTRRKWWLREPGWAPPNRFPPMSA